MTEVLADVEMRIVDPDRPPAAERHPNQSLAQPRNAAEPARDHLQGVIDVEVRADA